MIVLAVIQFVTGVMIGFIAYRILARLARWLPASGLPAWWRHANIAFLILAAAAFGTLGGRIVEALFLHITDGVAF